MSESLHTKLDMEPGDEDGEHCPGDNDLEVTLHSGMAEAVLARRGPQDPSAREGCWASRTRGGDWGCWPTRVCGTVARLPAGTCWASRTHRGDWGCWPARIYGCRWPGWPTGPDGPPGPTGATGAAGPQGPKGDLGPKDH